MCPVTTSRQCSYGRFTRKAMNSGARKTVVICSYMLVLIPLVCFIETVV